MTTATAAAAAPKTMKRVAAARFFAPLLKLRNGDFSAAVERVRQLPEIFYCRLGPRRVVYINDAALMEALLVKNHKHYHKDSGYDALRRVLGNGLLTSEDAFHLRQRRMIQPAFHKKRVDNYAACMVDYAERMARGWQDGSRLDIHHEMMNVTLSIIGKTMFNAEVGAEAARVSEALETVLRYSERYVINAVGNFFDMLPIESTRSVHHALATLDTEMYRIIDEHRASGKDTGDLLSMLLQAQYEDDGTGMSNEQLRDECITLFLAGHETTAIALSWTWYLLSQHPEIEARLHEELDAVLQGRSATAEDVERLAFTRRVFTESMRLYPPAFGFGRQAIRDNSLEGYAIRKGDNMVASPYMMQRLPQYFEQPDTFDPDRWLPERSAQLPKFAYFPFGGGVRKCVGEAFAWMEGILLVATVAQHWKMRLAPDARIAFDPKVTLRPRYGMPMFVEKR